MSYTAIYTVKHLAVLQLILMIKYEQQYLKEEIKYIKRRDRLLRLLIKRLVV